MFVVAILAKIGLQKNIKNVVHHLLKNARVTVALLWVLSANVDEKPEQDDASPEH